MEEVGRKPSLVGTIRKNKPEQKGRLTFPSPKLPWQYPSCPSKKRMCFFWAPSTGNQQSIMGKRGSLQQSWTTITVEGKTAAGSLLQSPKCLGIHCLCLVEINAFWWESTKTYFLESYGAMSYVGDPSDCKTAFSHHAQVWIVTHSPPKKRTVHLQEKNSNYLQFAPANIEHTQVHWNCIL